MKKRPVAHAVAGAVRRLPLRDALLQAVDLLRREEVAQAEPRLLAILEDHPQQADALHYLGVLRHTQGRRDEALALIRQSLAVLPTNASAWNNYGNLLLLANRADEAAEAYERALERADNTRERILTLNNLCTLYRKLGQNDRSEACARSALELDADFGDAWYNLSLTLLKAERVTEALDAHSKAVALWPEGMQPRHEVVRALMRLGELERARGLLVEWVAADPGNAVPQHMLAACEAGLGGQAPERASDAYVQEVFDTFASSFDAKLAALGYRAPALVVQALRLAAGEPAAALDICDAGVGTGLCGEGLRPFARSLEGCDLSAGMLQRAKALKLYDGLHQAELTHHLDSQPGAFDAVVSADTLCYFGAIDSAARAAWRSLRPGGWLVFTVEALADGDPHPHMLQPHGRYAHGRAYVEQALNEAGFTALVVRPDTLRMEGGEPVAGWVVSASKPGPAVG
jgi:predicted TPR repeat methyltransferase